MMVTGPQTTFLQRELRRRLDASGLSARALSRRAGLNESSVKMILNGRSRSPRYTTVAALARALGCTVPDLIGELGARESRAPGAAEEGAGALPAMASPAPATVAELDVHASAGGGAVVDKESEISRWGFPEPWLRAALGVRPADLRIVTIEGDSMLSDPPAAHDLMPGDKAIVNIADRTPSPPGLFLVHDGLGLVAKRVEYLPGSDPPTIRIMSNNAQYGVYERTLEEAHVMGRIVGRWQRL